MENCTLLQACEYLAFEWPPLDSIEDELFTEPKRGKQQNYLLEIDRAKKMLLHMFKNYGLKCYDDKNIVVALPEIVYDRETDSCNTYILCGLVTDPNFYRDNIPNGSMGIFVKDLTFPYDDRGYFPDIKIKLHDLEYIKQHINELPPQPKIWLSLTWEQNGFYIYINKICKLRIKKYDSESKLDTILKMVIEESPKTLTKAYISDNWPSDIIGTFDEEAERLDTIIKGALPSHVVKAFFPILNSKEIKCVCDITDLDLEQNGIQEMLIQSDSRQSKL